jgi:hypothetical protein
MEELTIQTRIARKDIAAIHKDAVAENRYCRIPIHGEIGVDIKAEWLDKALGQAEAANANVVLLDIDSPGGQVGEMARIMEVLSKHNTMRAIAFVHRAMSAAAIIALSIPAIIVDPRATIGAAVPFKVGPDGLPKDVDAKFLAAFRAGCQAAADAGRHNPLLARGMMDMNLILSVQGQGMTATVVEGRPDGSTPLKNAGEILCLSSAEAVRCGLAIATADSQRDIREAVGLKDWQPVGETVWSYLASRPVVEKANAQRESVENQRDEAREMLVTVEVRIAETTKAREEAAKRVSELPNQYKEEVASIDPRLTPAQHDAKAAEIRKKYDAQYADAQNTLGKAGTDLQELTKLRTELLAKLNM